MSAKIWEGERYAVVRVVVHEEPTYLTAKQIGLIRGVRVKLDDGIFEGRRS